MKTCNIEEAEKDFSEIINMLVDGNEDCIILEENGKPLAKIVPYVEDVSKRIGTLKGKYTYTDDFNSCDKEISEMFYGENQII